MEEWLGIIDYAHLTKTSISTIRRQIKKGKVEFKTVNGRYLIKRPEEFNNHKEKEILNSFLSPNASSLADVCKEIIQKCEDLLDENALLKLKLRQAQEEKLDLEMLISAYEYNDKQNFKEKRINTKEITL